MHESVRAVLDAWDAAGNGARPERSHAANGSLRSLDEHLVEVSGMLQLLHDFDGWCEDLPVLEEATRPTPPPPLPAATAMAAAAAGEPSPAAKAVATIRGCCGEYAAVASGTENGAAQATQAAEAAAAAVSACSEALAGDASSMVDEASTVAECASTAAGHEATPPARTPSRAPLNVQVTRKPSEARARLETYSQGLACAYMQGEVSYVECAVRLAAELAEV